MKWEHGIMMAEGDYGMIHSRHSNPDGVAIVVVDIMRIKDGVFEEYWDVIQPEATEKESESKLSMFGDSFPQIENQLDRTTASQNGITCDSARRVSANSGAYPAWSGDGKELFFKNLTDDIMVCPVAPKGSEIEVGTPQKLFHAASPGIGVAFDVFSDGKRVLVNHSEEEAQGPLQ
jgi:hypothetical protein